MALDSTDLIPGIYCEAPDLLRIPSLSLDPISENIETNTLSLKDLAVKIDLLAAKIVSFPGVSSNPLVRLAMQLLLQPLQQHLLLVHPCLREFHQSHPLLMGETAILYSLVSQRV